MEEDEILPGAIRLRDFVKYEIPAGFFIDEDRLEEVRKRLHELGFDTNLEGSCLWIYNGSESINVFADFVLMLYTVPEYAQPDAVVIKPCDLSTGEVEEKILSLPIVRYYPHRKRWDINWEIFEHIPLF
jgi:hypothetical protein